MRFAIRENILKIETDIFTTPDKAKLNTEWESKIALGNFPRIRQGIALQQLIRVVCLGVILPDEAGAVRGVTQNRYARKVRKVFSVFRRAIHAIRVR
ncbi:hypothetical protein [Ralstonia wenshanensis]|uniref:hypothetical protein n=1 Tax=Ralstonia wenshanensis TaxID=2842456 RepID=UPI002AAD1602|nr:hypothetical protein [Ralstonia wenshanensis]MDY7510576.1 hypothetical protein [Ralstonia wenshanensis]